MFELTEAKRRRRPIVLADVGRVRTSRTYPYGANVPRVRFVPSDRAAIEALLVEVISEGLRCDLFTRLAEKTLAARGRKGIALPRPPEIRSPRPRCRPTRRLDRLSGPPGSRCRA